MHLLFQESYFFSAATLTRAFNLPTSAFNHATRAFSLLTRGFELVTHESELVTCGFELVTRGFKLRFDRFSIIAKKSQSNQEQCSLCCSSSCFFVLLCTHYGLLQCFSTYFCKLKEIGV